VEETNRRTFGGLQFVRVPKGKFLLGSRVDNELAYKSEKPQQSFEFRADYWIGLYPVTNGQYAEFVRRTGHDAKKADDWGQLNDHPAVRVSWYDAQAYCLWLNEEHATEGQKGFLFRLPSEAEWEKAARGEFGTEWPWGNDFDPNKCNSSEGGKGGTTPVGEYSAAGGDSPYGVADMAGNVWEWTQSLFKPYPYDVDDGREDLQAEGLRVVRGGSFDRLSRLARCGARFGNDPYGFDEFLGFRVLVSPIHNSVI